MHGPLLLHDADIRDRQNDVIPDEALDQISHPPSLEDIFIISGDPDGGAGDNDGAEGDQQNDDNDDDDQADEEEEKEDNRGEDEEGDENDEDNNDSEQTQEDDPHEEDDGGDSMVRVLINRRKPGDTSLPT